MLFVSWCVRVLRLHRSLLAIFHRASWLPVGLSGAAFGLRSLYSDIEETPILSSEAEGDGRSWSSKDQGLDLFAV